MIKGPRVGPIAKNVSEKKILLNLHICILTQCFLGPEFFSMVWKKAVLNLGIKGLNAHLYRFWLDLRIFLAMSYLEKALSQSCGRKTFLARGISNMKNGDRICIFKNITSFIYDFIRTWCFLFFDFCIFYANLKFPVSNVPKKVLIKWEKNDILEKKIPMWRSTDRQALFLGWSHCWIMEEGTKLNLAIFWKI